MAAAAVAAAHVANRAGRKRPNPSIIDRCVTASGTAVFAVRQILSAGWLIVIGVVVGTALALGVARFAGALLFQLNPTDPTTVAMAIATLFFVGFVASFVPARRAAHVDPAIALRDE